MNIKHKITKSELQKTIQEAVDSMVPDLTQASSGELYEPDERSVPFAKTPSNINRWTNKRLDVHDKIIDFILTQAKESNVPVESWTPIKIYRSFLGDPSFKTFHTVQEFINSVEEAKISAQQTLKQQTGTGSGRISPKLMQKVKEASAMLSGLDWYYEYSDDPRVYRQGSSALSKASNYLVTNLPQKVINLVWKSYAPADRKDNPPISKLG